MEEIIEVLENEVGMNFSVSTVQKDIKAMREDEALGLQAPIAFSKAHNGYYYSDPNYTLASVALHEEDIEAISFATVLLSQFRGVPILEQYSAAVDKILETVNLTRALEGVDSDQIIQFEKIQTVRGNEWHAPVIEAIKERKKVLFQYRKFDADEAKNYVLHPYLLKEYRNRWYLVGMTDDEGAIRTFGLDRIESMEVLEEDRKLHPTFDAEEYFKHAFGITSHTEKPEGIVLSFTPHQGMYIKTQPLHQSQQILKDDDQEVRISLKVWPTYELKMQILSFGPEAKVLSPESFQKEIKELLRETLSRY